MAYDSACGGLAEQASLFAVGAMGAEERAAFEAHLDSCGLCRQEVHRVSQVLAELFRAAPPVAPAAWTRETLLGRIRDCSDKRQLATAADSDFKDRAESSCETAGSLAGDSPLLPQLQPGAGPVGAMAKLTARADDASWEPTAVPGVRMRVLSVDRERDQFSALVRMAAGASYPRHVHGGPEHCLVLEGDLRVGGEVLRTGDYQLSPAGSDHGVQSTEAGCLLFIMSSLHDSFA